MERQHPGVAFARYADDVVCHCDSFTQARALHAALRIRLAECRLELHPHKTRMVYCADSNRRKDYPEKRFDFLGYTFKPRAAMNRHGKRFISFSPAIGDKAGKALRRTIRSWGISRLSRYSLEELRARFNPLIQGWVRYYGRFHPSALQHALRTLDYHLVRWAQCKYKRLRGHVTRAWRWLNQLRLGEPTLFSHWNVAGRTTGR